MNSLRLLLFCNAAAAAFGSKAIVTKTSTADSQIAVYELDFASGKSTAIASVKKSSWNVVSGGAVCGGVYYAIFTDFATMSYGILSVDLGSTSPKIGVLPTNSLFHQVTCDPQSEKKLLGVASDSALIADNETKTLKASAGASFHLKRYDTLAQNETYVGSFPQQDVKWSGTDGLFSFKADGSEVWASWPGDACPDCPKSKKGGHLHVMDTTGGSIKKSVKISAGPLFNGANPYFLVPDAMRGVFDPGNAANLFWADLSFQGNSLTWKKAQAASDMWCSSKPQVNCQGNLLVPQKNGPLLLINPKDGSHVAEFDRSKIAPASGDDIGGVACDSTQKDDGAVLV